MPMTEFTVAGVRNAIDSLDSCFRAAAKEGKLENIFPQERRKLVSNKKYSYLLTIN